MIPIRDFNPTRRVPWVTATLIGLNLGVFLFAEPSAARPGAEQAYLFCHAEIPYEVTHHTSLAMSGSDAVPYIEQDYGLSAADAVQLERDLSSLCPNKSWLWSLFQAMFLHAGWFHLLGNMLYLWIFGDNVEDRLGRFRYLLFYLAGGLAASGLQLAMGPNSTVPNLGASGAIAAVLGAYLVFYPRARVLVFGFPLFLFPLPAVVVLGFWFVLQLFNGVASVGTQVNGGVAYWAHVGGFVFGLAVAWLFFRRPRYGREGPVPRPPVYSEER
jgi:membrane associated rhomboid family serine protease